MDLSVIIPTFGRGAKLAQCLRALAAQTLDQSRYEVLVGLDGPDQQAALMAQDVWSGERQDSLRIIECPREGLNATRNRLLAVARGRFMVSLNDDVIPAPGFLAAHLEAQDHAGPHSAIISGYSPWRIFDNDSLFDRLVRETSMIFFYDQMFEGSDDTRPRFGPDHDWGFRHCWGLNFSAPLSAVREVGGFIAVPLAYGYDDIELAWRLKQGRNMPVLFRPQARAVHDHRYQPGEVLDREHRLGQAAWHFAALKPEFSRAVFGRELRSESELCYSREFVQREAGAAERIRPMFLRMEEIPAAALGAAGDHAHDLVQIAYQQHLLLKRWSWRKGLLAAADQ
jgi:GT2 family glycosyltransferase